MATPNANTALRHAGTPVRKIEYVGYALGMMGYQVQNTVLNMYLLLYLTNVLQIPSIAAGSITLVCRFVDACTDIFFGTIGDRTHTRWGSYKPWYVTMAVPACLSFALLFIRPGFITPGTGIALAWAYFIYLIFGSVFTTIMYTAYGAFTSVGSADAGERNKLVMSRQMGLNLSGLLACCTMPLMLHFGNGDSNSPAAFAAMAIFLAVISVACYLLCGVSIKERVALNPGRKLPIRESFKVFKGNYLFLSALILNVLQSIGIAMFGGMMTYYFLYYKMNPAGMTPTQIVSALVAIAVNLLVLPWMMRRMKRSAIYMTAVILFVGLEILGYFLGGYEISGYLLMCAYTVCMMIVYAVTYSIIPDAVDYGEWRNGVSAPGTVNTVLSFIQKTTTGIGTLLIAVITETIGLDQSLGLAQSPAIQEGMRFYFFLAPTAFFAASALGLIFLRVTPEKMKQIRAELKERRAAANKEV